MGQQRGYDELSLLLSRYPELSAFRRFSRLSVKRLLYKQAEITYLEHELEFLSGLNKSDPQNAKALSCWWDFARSDDNPELDYQKEKFAELDAKLQDYHTSLKQTTEIMNLVAPPRSGLKTLRDWLGRRDGGDHFLEGVEAEPWEERNTDDLVSLTSAAHSDHLVDQIVEKVWAKYHRWIGYRTTPIADPDLGPIWEYQRRTFTLTGNILCTFLSFAIPTASVFALYYAQIMLVRLLLVSTFTFVFAITMMFMAERGRGEVFAATAAFAAVQVVFVGSVNLGHQAA